MKRVILAFVLIISCYHANGQTLEIPELEKHVGRNWRATPAERAYCQHIYYSIIVDTDQQGKIKSWKYNNDIPGSFNKQFDFLKNFQVPKKYKLENSTILFFITVDQTIVCPTATAHLQETTNVMTELLENIATQLGKNPRTRIIYRPFWAKLFNTILN